MPTTPGYSIRSIILLILGIGCGLLLPYVVKSWVKRLETGRFVEISQSPTLSSTVPTITNSDKRVTSSQSIKSTKLQEERKRLLDRLKQVEDELEKLVTKDRFTVPTLPAQSLSTPTPQPTRSSKTKCKYPFKVYVYPIPASLSVLQISEEARQNRTLHVCRKCIYEQFSLEYIIYDFFTSFCGRVFNPQEADYFYLPLVRDAEFRLQMLQRGARSRDPSQVEQILLDTLEKNDTSQWKTIFNVTDEFWHRRNGRDHVIVMPAPVTNLRHETNQRGFFHYMLHLFPPIFLSLEYSLSFLQEYPHCTRKNLLVPYPVLDPEVYNGKLLGERGAGRRAPPLSRPYLLYYAGGMHGECVEVRLALKDLLHNGSSLFNVTPPVPSSMGDREKGFLLSKFCPIPIGDSPSSKRMYDVLNFGCVPVTLSDDLLWAFGREMGGSLSPPSFSLFLPQSVVHFTGPRSLRLYREKKREMGVLPSGVLVYDLLEESVRQGGEWEGGRYVNPLIQILRKVSPEDLLSYQIAGREAAAKYRYYALDSAMREIPLTSHRPPDGGAIEMIGEEMALRLRNNTLDKIYAECKKEREAKHKYIGRYYCDAKDTVDSLLPPKPPKPVRGGRRGRKEKALAGAGAGVVEKKGI